jgi:AcrR family transcriptional regulator
MPLPRSESPRKLPTQARARTTVDAILRATAHILRSQGWDACNTNAVAKRAGVSIGSLYQYFPSKEALIIALAEAHAVEGHGVLLAALAEVPSGKLTLEGTVRHYIRAMVALHQVDPKLHRVLSEQVPRLKGGLEVVQRVSNQSAVLVQGWLESQRELIRELDVEVATYVLVTAVEALVHLEVMKRPAQLDDDVLIEEVSELVLGYLGARRTRS